MAFRNCFSTPNKSLNSNEYIERKKSKVLYRGAVKLAENNGVYNKKSSLGKNKGTYVGDINISRDGKKCLIGAKNYSTLLSVTNGKYLVNPNSETTYISDKQLWNGLMYNMDLTSNPTILSYPDGSENTFTYPVNENANNTYPSNIPPKNLGLVVDPSYTLFYPNCILTATKRSNCYLKHERAYQKYITNIEDIEKDYEKYITGYNGYIGGYQYPQKFSFRVNCISIQFKNNGGRNGGQKDDIYYAVSIAKNNNWYYQGQHISEWDTSEVENMKSLFSTITFNEDISNWNVENVTNMYGMFNYTYTFNKPLNSWNVGKVTDMGFMFTGLNKFNQPLNDWNVRSVKNMKWMFKSASVFNQTLNRWSVKNVNDMTRMFEEATNFNGDISVWNTGKVTSMDRMFNIASKFNQNIGNWNVENVTDMYSMFNNVTNFNQDITEWKVNNVNNMKWMFKGATKFNQNISGWNVKNVAYMESMFEGATEFDQNIRVWETKEGTIFTQMFKDATAMYNTYGIPIYTTFGPFGIRPPGPNPNYTNSFGSSPEYTPTKDFFNQ